MKKKTMAPGRQVEDPPPLSLSFLPFPSTAVLHLYSYGTQHVVSAFIIIIIISVDGPLMKRRLGRPGEIQEVREEGGRVDSAAQQEQQEVKVGPYGEDKTKVKEEEEKMVTERWRNREERRGLPSRVSWLASR
ncbi:unnamed protein product [Lasius platythorax]|uniref:Uncharacterized protein n=1 Tax=Lasius platythorax TaxID=488582 RepID=A0AAV2N511_9HYME